ncbi:uncharacterized protein (DUF983 family) [Roseiarcus fermentans]|uniref:Uncharacterized protein (DUF983 family) n=1 Tax=Roseiarcus fermentans TaxID=1473586 RepID=A0A366FGH7_9HYPH|nr:DUF983 domain-containing protein [Roseiarcus fermentans]RBP13774.1 uncharacterized protein (DUF983 family) [Roseiarcus fermentans]
MNDMSGFRAFGPPRRQRRLGEAVKRGLLGRCPACGRGRLFRGYLALDTTCRVCGEDLSHARADDAPAYLTLLIVCHVAGAGILMSDDVWPGASLTATILVWLAVATATSLALLPRMKGAVVGSQWALGMHGFGGEET